MSIHTGYETDFLDEIMADQKTITFEDMDEIMIEEDIPLDISKLIYEMYNPVCDKCKKCCKICKYYCYYECGRGERDVCCKYEMGSLFRKYDLFNKID